MMVDARSIIAVFIVLLVFLTVDGRVAIGQNLTADDLALRWGVETNRVDDGNRFRSSFTIANHGDVALGTTHWTLYFNFSRQIDPASVTAPVRITRLNGDFYRLEPDADLPPIEPGDQLRVTVEAPGSVIKRIDAPAGFYVVFRDAEGRPRPPCRT